MAEVAVELVVGVLPDAARVEEDDVSLLDIVGGLHAVGFEQASKTLGVVLVHLAPEGADEVLAGHAARLLSRLGTTGSSWNYWALSCFRSVRTSSGWPPKSF